MNAQLLNAVLGLAGEAGEFSEDVKHALFHGRAFDVQNAKKELGDLLWYVAQGADALGFTLEEVAQANVEKLRARYPEGFSRVASAARADERVGEHRDPEEAKRLLDGEASPSPGGGGASRARGAPASLLERSDEASLTTSRDADAEWRARIRSRFERRG